MENQEKQGAEQGIAAKKLIGMQVYTIHEGDSLGNVKDILLDPNAKRAVALLVEKKGMSREARLIPFEKVANIGDDAVIVQDRGSAARAAGQPHMVKYLERPAALYGIRVITTKGQSLGRMEEYHLDRQTGFICQLDVIGGRGHVLSGRASLPASALLTIGKAAIMVEAANAQEFINQETQLQQAMSEMKEKAGQAWQTTVSAGKRLGQNITSSLNRLLEEEENNSAATEPKPPLTPPIQPSATPHTPGESNQPDEPETSQLQPPEEAVLDPVAEQPTPKKPRKKRSTTAKKTLTKKETIAETPSDTAPDTPEIIVPPPTATITPEEPEAETAETPPKQDA